MKTKITIHRALAELKLIDSKIEKQIEEIKPVGVQQKGKLIDGFIKEDDFVNNAKSKRDSILALFDNKVAIKKAIVESNSKTLVTIAGKTMTVADAITNKTTVTQAKSFAQDLISKYNTVIAKVNKGNEVVNSNLQKILEASLGKDNVKTSGTEVEAITKPYLEANELHLFDPLEINKLIEKITKEVTEFETEVDAVLSESNAITFIEI